MKIQKRPTASHDDNFTSLHELLMRRIGPQLPAILRGQVDPTVLMSGDDLLSRFNTESKGMSRLYYATATFIQRLAFQNPALHILDLCGHDATLQILEDLGAAAETTFRSVQYEIAGESRDIPKKLAPWAHILKQRRLDPTKLRSSLNVEKGYYDVIIMADDGIVNKTTKLIDLRSLLKTGGRLINFQNQQNRNDSSLLPFATLPGWWAEDGDDGYRGADGKRHFDLIFILQY